MREYNPLPCPYEGKEPPKSLKEAEERLLEKYRKEEKVDEKKVLLDALKETIRSKSIKQKAKRALELALKVLTKLEREGKSVDYSVRDALKKGNLKEFSEFLEQETRREARRRKVNRKEFQKRYFELFNQLLNEYLETIGREEGWDFYLKNKVIFRWEFDRYVLKVVEPNEQDLKRKRINAFYWDRILKRREEDRKALEEIKRQYEEWVKALKGEEKKETEEVDDLRAKIFGEVIDLIVEQIPSLKELVEFEEEGKLPRSWVEEEEERLKGFLDELKEAVAELDEKIKIREEEWKRGFLEKRLSEFDDFINELDRLLRPER